MGAILAILQKVGFMMNFKEIETGVKNGSLKKDDLLEMMKSREMGIADLFQLKICSCCRLEIFQAYTEHRDEEIRKILEG